MILVHVDSHVEVEERKTLGQDQAVKLAKEFVFNSAFALRDFGHCGRHFIGKVLDIDPLIGDVGPSDLKKNVEVGFDVGHADALHYSDKILSEHSVRVLEVAPLQAIVETLSRILKAGGEFKEEGLVDAITKEVASVANVGVKLVNEIVVGDCAIWLSRHRFHKVIDLIVGETNVEGVEALAELLPVDEAIPVPVEHRECLLQVKVIDEEGSSHLIEHFVQPLLLNLNSLESLAELV